MRACVGPTDESAFDNASGDPILPFLPESAYAAILDFGCGCGRAARQLMQQRLAPGRYVGLDLHQGMIRWCQANLQPLAPQFEFRHHDVFNLGFNPGSDKPRVLKFPVEDRSFTLVHAWSVFTHLLQPDAEFYMAEAARVLQRDGYFAVTFFLFDKTSFPMMQEFQNALYINEVDPTNAVIFDRVWLSGLIDSVGLTITDFIPPNVRGFQWVLVLRHKELGVPSVDLPEDLAPSGVVRAPLMPASADRIGMA